MEDIDTPRIVAGAAARIAQDLAWLGLDYDEGPREGGSHAPYTQSERLRTYQAALDALTARGLTYPCDCSRAEIARAASAPHAGEELVYPGTCRDADPRRPFKRDPSIRLRIPHGTRIGFVDAVAGPVEQVLEDAVGDFVLRRGDGVFAYQLVVAVDDAAMEITDVVRAVDLLTSTPRQLLLMDLLAMRRVPRYAHLPMVVSSDGERLAKRAGATSVRALREQGLAPEDILGPIAVGLGLVDGPSRPLRLTDILRGFRGPEHWRRAHDPWPAPDGW